MLANGAPPKRGRYRSYDVAKMRSAYDAVQKGMSVREAARKFCLPYATLQDRACGKISIDCAKPGPAALLSMEEEKHIFDHVQTMAMFGYDYTRAEVTELATDFSIYLGKRSKDDRPLSMTWFYSFLERWQDLKVHKTRSLALQRANVTSEEVVNHYFEHLGEIMDKYDLKSSPQRIYNIDEKGLMEYHTPPSVVTARQSTAVAATNPRSSMTTIIGCGNAAGSSIPPYFVFKGKRMREELMESALPAALGTVSDSGWPNTEIFENYLEEHFLKFAVAASEERPLLVLYDGHATHVSLSLITWAHEHNIILFVLPAHTSQMTDVGCFGPFSTIYNELRHEHMRESGVSYVARNHVSELASAAYSRALKPSILKASFKKCGIFPFDKSTVNAEIFKPAPKRQKLSGKKKSPKARTSSTGLDLQEDSEDSDL